jgi:hypothetical protein
MILRRSWLVIRHEYYRYRSIKAIVTAALRGDYDYLPLSSDQFHLQITLTTCLSTATTVYLLPSSAPHVPPRRQPRPLPDRSPVLLLRLATGVNGICSVTILDQIGDRVCRIQMCASIALAIIPEVRRIWPVRLTKHVRGVCRE